VQSLCATQAPENVSRLKIRTVVLAEMASPLTTLLVLETQSVLAMLDLQIHEMSGHVVWESKFVSMGFGGIVLVKSFLEMKHVTPLMMIVTVKSMMRSEAVQVFVHQERQSPVIKARQAPLERGSALLVS
tara:strand:+ start:6629 stop:7018 length:390 start_codon:yes stop_codon:yes gene_type:complete